MPRTQNIQCISGLCENISQPAANSSISHGDPVDKKIDLRSTGRPRPVGIGFGFELWIFEAGASIYSSTGRPRPVGIGFGFELWIFEAGASMYGYTVATVPFQKKLVSIARM